MKRFIDRQIIKYCLKYENPFPKRIQKRVLKTAFLHMYRYDYMCIAISDTLDLLYNIRSNHMDYSPFIPIFHKNNFACFTGIKTCVGNINNPWCEKHYRLPRMKFLKWCIENVY